MFQLESTYRFCQIPDKRMKTFSQSLELMRKKKKMKKMKKMMMLVLSNQLYVVYLDFLIGNRSAAVNLEVKRGASRSLVSILLRLLHCSLVIDVSRESKHKQLRRSNSTLDNVY